MDSRNTTHVRLDLVHLTRAQLSDCQSVHDASVIEIIQQSKLSRCRCYDYLSTDFVSDSVVFAELNQTAVSLATQPCLKTSGFVIDTGMNNSAVPASLMPGPVFLLLENSDAGGPVLLQNRPSHGKPHDASANHDAVKSFHDVRAFYFFAVEALPQLLNVSECAP